VSRSKAKATRSKNERANPGRETRSGLARALSKLGCCSRAQAAQLIRAGRVRLNGGLRRDPEAPVRLGRDRIEIDGEEIRGAAKAYWMLNKPRGAVTTAADERGRETVYAYLPSGAPWLAPVGRLDKASEGLLLLTNDSAWAARITAPQSHVEKTYHVQIGAVANDELLQRLREGVRVAGGEALRVKSATILRRGERNSWIAIVLDEGKNRQIRRMLEALGIEVLRLVRVAIGGLQLGDLAKGKCRELSVDEILALGEIGLGNRMRGGS
jgi:23S rRNA pseudouridine2605 synthase